MLGWCPGVGRSNETRASILIARRCGSSGTSRRPPHKAVRFAETVKDGVETLMTEWHDKDEAIAAARCTVEAAEEVKLAEYSAVPSGATATQAIAFRETFNGPARVLPPPPKYHSESRGQGRKEKCLDDKANSEGRDQSGGESASSATPTIGIVRL